MNPIRTRGRIRRDPTAGIVPRAFRYPGGVGPGRQPSASRFFFFFFSFVKRERFLSFSFLFGILLVTLRFFLAALPCVTASFFFLLC